MFRSSSTTATLISLGSISKSFSDIGTHFFSFTSLTSSNAAGITVTSDDTRNKKLIRFQMIKGSLSAKYKAIKLSSLNFIT